MSNVEVSSQLWLKSQAYITAAAVDIFVNLSKMIHNCGGIIGQCDRAHPIGISAKKTKIYFKNESEKAMKNYFHQVLDILSLVHLREILILALPHATHGVFTPTTMVPEITALIDVIDKELWPRAASTKDDLVQRIKELTQENESLRETMAMVAILTDPRLHAAGGVNSSE